MALFACGCQCASTQSLIRSFLKRQGYRDWVSIPIEMGKEKSLHLIERLPSSPELDMLRGYLRDRGKWAVIIGVGENGCRWCDLTSGIQASINGEFIVRYFS